MFALRSTYHTTLQATPMQLIFSRDTMLNIKFQADWQLIKQLKQDKIHKIIQMKTRKEFHINTRLEIKFYT